MVGLSFQIIVLVAIALTLLLAAFAVYVRIRQTTYTEKRFSFVALWACTSIVSVTFLSITDVQLISIALAPFGVKLPVTTFPEKILLVLLAAIYCYLVRDWALNWNGLLTEEGKKNKDRRRVNGLLIDGVSETLRILQRRPSPKVFRGTPTESQQLSLTPPLDELPLHEQIRALVEAKWTEYDIADDGWVGEIGCWQGKDRAFNRPILIACGVNSRDLQLGGLVRLATVHAGLSGVRILCVFREVTNGTEIAEAVTNSSFDVQILTLNELVKAVANFDEYRRAIEHEFNEKRLPDANFAIADVLAPTRVRAGLEAIHFTDVSERDSSVDFRSMIFDWLQEKTDRQLALLGEYGQGKSTSVLALTYSLLFDADLRNGINRIPILVRLTGRSPSTTRLAELLGAWGARHNISGQVLFALGPVAGVVGICAARSPAT